MRQKNYMPIRQIHLDFHTSEKIENIAQDFDAEEFAITLSNAHVDSINIFAKCHHGMLYYETKSNAKHPHLKKNILKGQIDACRKYNIQCPIYISVGLDEFAAERHSDWIEVSPDGKRVGAPPLQAGWRKMCLNNPEYLAYLKDQIDEVMDFFQPVDGIWLDIISQGECCCRWCLNGMKSKGLDPENGIDRRSFAENVLINLKKEFTAFIHEKTPSALIFWNAGHVSPYIRKTLDCYTHLDLESLPSGGWGYDHFPATARYARNLGKEFTGMTGKFLKSWGDFGGFKTLPALEYECFLALALCGGCGIGDQLHPRGRLAKATYDLVGKVYEKVEKVEPWCVNASAVTEIGVVNPEIASPGAAHSMNEVSAGIHRMLKETGYQYDFIDFEMDLSKYKIVILPDIIRLNADEADKINSYLKEGGKLVASHLSGMGSDGYDFLIEGMPASVIGDADYSPDFLSPLEPISDGIPQAEYVMYERGLKLAPSANSTSLSEVWNPFFNRTYERFCSHSHTPADKPAGYPGIVMNNSIVYTGYPIFGMYKRHGAKVYRDMIINSLKLLLPNDQKLVCTNAPTTADILLNYQPNEDRYVLHLLNYIPEKRYSIDTIEDIIPLYNIDVSIKLPNDYKNVEVIPSRLKLATKQESDRISFTIPEINGWSIICIRK